MSFKQLRNTSPNRCVFGLLFSLLLSFGVAPDATAQSLAEGRGAEWTLKRESSCFAIYKGRQQVRLTGNSFIISFEGHPAAGIYAYRLDDAAPVRALFLNPAAQGATTLTIDGAEFDKLRRAKRFRLLASIVLSTTMIEDIDLSKLPAALDQLRGPACGS
jgi:hypothetical protein